MFESRLLQNVKGDERLVQIVRRYWLTLTTPILASIVLIVAPFFFLVPLFRLGTKGVAGFTALLILGILWMVRTLMVYSLNVFILTDMRIIDVDQRGFFNRSVSECLYRNIQDVSIRVKGLAATMFHYGNIIIQTAGSASNVELEGVKDPQKVQEVISRLVEESEHSDDGDGMSAAELLQLAQQMKQGLKPEQFRRLFNRKTEEGTDSRK